MELVRYLHLNPARLQKPQDPAQYRWSSHHAYLGSKGPIAVDTALVLGQLGNAARQASKAYRKFIDEGRGSGHESRYYETVDQRFLGDEKFVEDVVERAPQAGVRRGGRKVRFEILLQAVATVHGCGVKELLAVGRQRALAKPRAQLAYLAREWCAMKVIEIARRLHRDPSMVSRLCAQYEAARDSRIEMKLAKAIDK